MKKIFTRMAMGVALLACALPAAAQTSDELNLLAKKEVSPLGGYKEWISIEGKTYTCEEQDKPYLSLQSITEVPANGEKIYLFPQGQQQGGFLSSENKYADQNLETGIQGIYIDMGKICQLGSVDIKWEGAYATSYKIWLLDEEPTSEDITVDPIYSVTDNKDKDNEISLEESNGSYPSGQYLVLQPYKAFDWTWGVGIFNMKAFAPLDGDELVALNASPLCVAQGVEMDMTFQPLNQLGKVIESDDIVYSVSGDATLSDGKLTVNSGNSVEVTATYNDMSESVTIYVASAPEAPEASVVAAPLYTAETVNADDKITFTTAWEGGATNYGSVSFENGEIGQLFTETYCVYFANETQFADNWQNNNINPSEDGYTSLCLSVFSAKNLDCNIYLEATPGNTAFPQSLTAGEWNNLTIDLSDIEVINNMSIRFNKDGESDDIILANIYFTGDVTEEDDNETKYYLVGNMTQGTEDFTPNPSYMFHKTSEGNLVMTVGSMSTDARFYVAAVTGEDITSWGSNTDQDTALKVGNSINLVSGEKEMGLGENYLNVTFQLILDVHTSNPTALKVTAGDVDGSIWTITPGNDQTMQSGTVSGTDIQFFTEAETVTLFVYASTDYVGKNVWYTLTAEDTNTTTQTYADEAAATEATVNSDGYFMVRLYTGKKGTLNIYATDDTTTTPLATFTYTVNKGIPVMVEGIEAEEGEAVYYTLQGVRVDNPTRGIYLRVHNGRTTKVVL